MLLVGMKYCLQQYFSLLYEFSGIFIRKSNWMFPILLKLKFSGNLKKFYIFKNAY